MSGGLSVVDRSRYRVASAITAVAGLTLAVVAPITVVAFRDWKHSWDAVFPDFILPAIMWAGVRLVVRGRPLPECWSRARAPRNCPRVRPVPSGRRFRTLRRPRAPGVPRRDVGHSARHRIVDPGRARDNARLRAAEDRCGSLPGRCPSGATAHRGFVSRSRPTMQPRQQTGLSGSVATGMTRS